MRSNSKGAWAAFALASSFLVLAGAGCQNALPGFGAYQATGTTPNTNRVDQFDSGSVSINPKLFENSNPPNYVLRSPGAVTLVNNFASYGSFHPVGSDPNVGLDPGGYVSANCFRMSGAVTDTLDNTFPALDLEVPLENYNFYDANHFTGVKFYMKVANDDTAFHRVFAVPVAQTVPSGTNNGTCPAGPKRCYDHFAADYSGGTGGNWILSSYNFSDLTQLQSGYAPQPYATLTGGNGFNLKQTLWLQWEEGNNNKKPGEAVVDLYVDDIEFF
ncbi:MAG TPA: hypothetical protein VFR02_04855 [bacterium]|nr:hypothetical protein [bacterium]